MRCWVVEVTAAWRNPSCSPFVKLTPDNNPLGIARGVPHPCPIGDGGRFARLQSHPILALQSDARLIEDSRASERVAIAATNSFSDPRAHTHTQRQRTYVFTNPAPELST